MLTIFFWIEIPFVLNIPYFSKFLKKLNCNFKLSLNVNDKIVQWEMYINNGLYDTY